MKTAGGRKPKPLGHSAQQPSEWRGRSEQISLDQVGCEARKLPALGEISFLTSSFIELLVTYLHWERLSKLTDLARTGGRRITSGMADNPEVSLRSLPTWRFVLGRLLYTSTLIASRKTSISSPL